MRDGLIGYTIKEQRRNGHIVEITKRTDEAMEGGFAPFGVCRDFCFYGTADTFEEALGLAAAALEEE